MYGNVYLTRISRICIVIIIFLILSNESLISQTFIVFGTIKDTNTREILPFTNISIKGNKGGTIADAKGSYKLTLPEGTYDLIFSFIGYKTEIIPINLNDRDIILNINLFSTDFLFQTVTVYSSKEGINGKEELSNLTLQSERIEEMSTVFRDVFRSLQSLPGISVDNELSAKFNVRGGNYDENLVLVNGAQVYEPFHIKEATYASVGIFNVDLMKKVDLITGGFSAEYGDKMSSILNIEYREGNKESLKGSASLSLASFDFLAEGPITENGSFIIGARKSYFEYMMSLFDIDDRIHPSLYDVQGVLSYHFSSKNHLLFQFIYSGDNFRYDPELSVQTYSNQGQYKSKPATYNQSTKEFGEEKS